MVQATSPMLGAAVAQETRCCAPEGAGRQVICWAGHNIWGEGRKGRDWRRTMPVQATVTVPLRFRQQTLLFCRKKSSNARSAQLMAFVERKGRSPCLGPKSATQRKSLRASAGWQPWRASVGFQRRPSGSRELGRLGQIWARLPLSRRSFPQTVPYRQPRQRPGSLHLLLAAHQRPSRTTHYPTVAARPELVPSDQAPETGTKLLDPSDLCL